MMFTRLFLVSSLLVLLAGCYDSKQEIIRASDAMSMYGLPGYYNTDGGGSLEIWAIPNSNDYRFKKVGSDGKVSNGYLRAIWLRDNLYVIQAKQDDSSLYYIMFYEYTSSPKSFQEMYVSDGSFDRKWALQDEFAVKINVADFGSTLEGHRADVFAFLIAHKRLRFEAGYRG